MNFDDQIIAEFESFDHSKFSVSFTPPRIFLCGGEIDNGSPIPKSARHRVIEYFCLHEKDLFKACVQAEEFKDYFKEGAYSDLLEFETDIASIATLIIIFLESPGSLVELGLFCANTSTAEKLLIIAPQEELENEDSFIFLGPLTSIKKRSNDSVLSYPWPSKEIQEYEHTNIIANDIKTKLTGTQKTQKFSSKNPAHIALLIYDIVLLTHPITITEIELALLSLGIDTDQNSVSRLLYLLEKLKLISHTTYSSVKYYFDTSNNNRRIKFGTNIKGKTRDTPAITMAFRQTYLTKDDEQSRKRTLALKHINIQKSGIK